MVFPGTNPLNLIKLAFWTNGHTTASAHWSRKRTWNMVITFGLKELCRTCRNLKLAILTCKLEQVGI
jgi:hypothetical protein